MAFRWPECRRTAGKWLESFHAMMWCWWCAWQGLRGGRASGRRRDRAATELELTGAVVRAARVRESEIGRVCEPQWVAAVLLEHWIAGGRRRRRLMATGRSCDGAPVRSNAREEGRQWKSECVKARVSSLGAQGCASSRGGGTASESRCWQAGGRRGALGRRRRDVEGRGGASGGRAGGGRGAGGHVAQD
jgi:hypothetical protein